MKRYLSVALAAPALLFLYVGTALADATTTVDATGFWALLMPYIASAVGALITFLIGWVLMVVKTKLNISIDDSMRASLQTAATNAAGLVLNKLGNSLPGTIDVKNPLIAEAVPYVLTAAKGAVDHFGLTPDDIAHKILALLPQVANTAIAPASK